MARQILHLSYFAAFGFTLASIWLRKIWSSGVSLKRLSKMQFTDIDLKLLWTPSKSLDQIKLWSLFPLIFIVKLKVKMSKCHFRVYNADCFGESSNAQNRVVKRRDPNSGSWSICCTLVRVFISMVAVWKVLIVAVFKKLSITITCSSLDDDQLFDSATKYFRGLVF